MQRRLPVRATVISLMLSAAALAQVPHLYPRVVLPGESIGSSFWLLAPKIAAVRIQRVEWVGPEIEITPPQRTVVRLVSVDAEVENVIQGELPGPTIRFYFFANTLSPNGYHTVLSWLEPGKRYVVFLREDGGVFRTMADVAALNIRILSGRHDQIQNTRFGSESHDPGVSIAYLALAPSVDVDEGFAANIERTCNEVAQFVQPATLARLLRDLLLNPKPDVMAQACLAISRRFTYRDTCLPKLLDSSDDVVRQQAEIWLRKRWTTKQLVTALKEAPFSLSVSGMVDDLAAELELFILDSDPAVREQVCETIHRLFPLRQVPGCVSSKK